MKSWLKPWVETLGTIAIVAIVNIAFAKIVGKEAKFEDITFVIAAMALHHGYQRKAAPNPLSNGGGR
ncbi:MAG: hypothetical protein F9K41_15920 [Sphingopyxis terrae]|nr:MAG: hypothetical protein F9K41_15920 [Sphingopyxis terrae]